MKKLFEEDDHEQDKMERARILMAVIPVVLILLILAFMLIKSRIGQGREDKEDLQQSIMDYADGSRRCLPIRRRSQQQLQVQTRRGPGKGIMHPLQQKKMRSRQPQRIKTRQERGFNRSREGRRLPLLTKR